MADGSVRFPEGPPLYPGRGALRSRAEAPAWIPMYFAGFSGPGWQGFQLDLGVAEVLVERGEYATTDEACEALRDLRATFRRAQEEHAKSLEVDTLAPDEDQMELRFVASRARGKIDHPPPPLEHLLGAVRPCGTVRRDVAGGKPGATDREVAERMEWVYKHRGRTRRPTSRAEAALPAVSGLTEEDLSWQFEWTEARALTGDWFLRRDPRADFQPSLPPSIECRLPTRSALVRKIVAWLIFADVHRWTGITMSAPRWVRVLGCKSKQAFWDAWKVVEHKLQLGISMQRFQPSPREKNKIRGGSPVCLTDNWWGVGPELAKLRSVYLPEEQLELDLRAKAERHRVPLEELQSAHRDHRQVARDETLRRGRRCQARMKRTNYKRALRRCGKPYVPRGSRMLTLGEFCYDVAAVEARLDPLREQLAALRRDHGARAFAFWSGGAVGDLPELEGFPQFWSVADASNVPPVVLVEPTSLEARASMLLVRLGDLEVVEEWLSQVVEISNSINGANQAINTVQFLDGIPASQVSGSFNEDCGQHGLSAAAAGEGAAPSPRRGADPGGADEGLQNRASNRAEGAAKPQAATAPRPAPPGRPPEPRPGSPPTARGDPNPRATSPPAAEPDRRDSRVGAADMLAGDLSRMANPELAARIEAALRASRGART